MTGLRPILLRVYPELPEIAALARSIAEEAADLIRAALDGPRQDVSTKSSPTDMVTEIDRASEALIVRRIQDARPDDGILGEEGTAVAGISGYRWVIDPIDGTANFVHRHPGFAVSIAVEYKEQAVAGVVLDVMLDALYCATLGGGATRNCEAIHASPVTEVPKALIATGFSFDPGTRARQGQVVATLLPQVADIRRMGAAAVDLCSVASGRVDGYFERGLNPWDYAAGGLIASEAGARIGAIDGGPAVPGSIIAAPPAIFDELRALVVAAEDRARPLGPGKGRPSA